MKLKSPGNKKHGETRRKQKREKGTKVLSQRAEIIRENRDGIGEAWIRKNKEMEASLRR